MYTFIPELHSYEKTSACSRRVLRRTFCKETESRPDSAELAQRSVREQPEVLITPRQARSATGLVREDTIDDDQVISLTDCASLRPEDGPFAEQYVGSSIEHLLDTFIVAVDWNDFGVDLEFIKLAVQPSQSRGARDG